MFILLIFVSHFVQYLKPEGMFFDPYYRIRTYLGQMVVASFLFYSGYGIVYSIENKGPGYLKQMPVRRILKVLVQMAVAVLVYLLVQTLRGNRYSFQRILLSFIGWEGIGNSNWYIFAILFLYFATYLVYQCLRKCRIAGLKVLAVSVLIALFVWFMISRKEDYWYNTVFAYVAGCGYYYIKNRADQLLKNNWSWIITFLVLCAGFGVLRKHWSSIAAYEASAVVFALGVMLLTMKLKFTNPVLRYCGEHLFSLFILHRIPMILLQKTAIGTNFWIYFPLSIAIAFLLSWLFDKAFPLVWKPIERFFTVLFGEEHPDGSIVQRLKQYQFLFEELVKRDFKKKYKRTVLGMAWSILSPLLMLLVMRLVFTQFFGRNTPHYTTYLFCGNLVFSFFNESSTQGITFTWRFVLLLCPIGMLVLFNIGVGLILSALFVFFRDIQYLWTVFTQLLMYMSAIFYTIDRYPENVQNLFLLNPVYLFIRYFRKIVIEATIPTVWFHLLMLADVLIVVGLGCWMYKKYNHRFLYYV